MIRILSTPIHRKIQQKIRLAIQQAGGLEGVHRILVGISGGVDSTVLLHQLCFLFVSKDPEVVAVHIHHGLRGKEADRDAKTAETLARIHGCEFHVRHIGKQLRKNCAEHEMREARLSALEQIAKQLQASRVFLGHQQDDQAETLLFRFLGGSDLKGLGGIRWFRPPLWVHPMLGISRKEILEEAKACHLPFIEDSSNRSIQARRNFLRHKMIPLIQEWVNPQVVPHLSVLASSLSKANEYLEIQAEQLLKKALQGKGGYRILPLLKAHSALRDTALELAFRKVGGGNSVLRRPQLMAVNRLLSSPEKKCKTFSLPHGILAIRHSDRLEFRKVHP